MAPSGWNQRSQPARPSESVSFEKARSAASSSSRRSTTGGGLGQTGAAGGGCAHAAARRQAKERPRMAEGDTVSAQCTSDARPPCAMLAGVERPRRILHVDMDAFYASVEQRD